VFCRIWTNVQSAENPACHARESGHPARLAENSRFPLARK
jgi:hypothetical protein